MVSKDDQLRTGRRVHAVEHAFDVLDALVHSRCALGVSEVARRVELSKSTVHALLTTLEDRGMVVRDPVSRDFRPGIGLLELGAGALRSIPVFEAAQPDLSALANLTGESVHIGIPTETGLSYVVSLNAHRTRAVGRHRKPTRSELPLHATAGGKLFLAYAKEDVITRVTRFARSYTTRTLVEPDRLRSALDEVREQGFATSWGEHRADLSAVAVPIFGVGAHPEAALTVAGPLTELTPQRTPQILENMRSAARHIESELGTGIRAS